MARLSHTLSSFLWSFLEQGGVTFASLVVQIVLARLLAPEAFGTLAILLVVTDIVNVLAQSGLGLALVQRGNASSLAYSSAFWASMILSALLYVLTFLASPLVAQFYGMPDLAIYLRVAALTIFFNSFNSIQRAYLQDKMKFKLLFIKSIIVVVISGLGGILAALAGLGVWALIIQSVIQSVVSCGVMMTIIPWKPKREFSLPLAKELLRYGGNVCLTGILGVLYTGISELIIGKTCSPSQLGYYTQGRKWPKRVITVISNALQNVLFPVLSHMKDDKVVFLATLRRALSVGNYVIFPASVLLTLVAEPLVALLLTEKWLPSVPVFQYTCLSYSVLMFELVSLRGYMALGDSRLYLRLQLVKVVLGGAVLAVVALCSRDIYTVAFAAMALGVAMVFIVDMQPAKRVLGYSRLQQIKDGGPTVVITCVAAMATFVVALIPASYILRLFFQIIAFLCVYIAMSYAFKLKPFTDCVVILRSLLDKGDAS